MIADMFFLSSLFKTNQLQNLSKRLECDKLELNGPHRDRAQAYLTPPV